MRMFGRLLLPWLLGLIFIASCSTTSNSKAGGNIQPQPAAPADVNDNAIIVVITGRDNGRRIAVKRGNVIRLELVRSGGTGYEWYLDESCKEYFDLLKEDKEEISKKGLVGTPVITRWQLKAVRQGDAELKLLLYRNWEGKEKAASSFQVGVKIL